MSEDCQPAMTFKDKSYLINELGKIVITLKNDIWLAESENVIFGNRHMMVHEEEGHSPIDAVECLWRRMSDQDEDYWVERRKPKSSDVEYLRWSHEDYAFIKTNPRW